MSNQKIIEQEEEKTIMNNEQTNKVSVVWKLATKKGDEITIDDLYQKLKNEYRVKGKRGLTCFEYFNAVTQMVKPHFDYEEYVSTELYSDEMADEIQDNVRQTLDFMFNCQEDDL